MHINKKDGNMKKKRKIKWKCLRRTNKLKSWKTRLIVKNSTPDEIVYWYMRSLRIKKKTQTNRQ